MFPNRYKLLLVVFCFAVSFASAQITGTITAADSGDPLPFASVYVEGSTTGTTSNPEGEYRLEIEPGQYRLVFQYLGYESLVREVNYQGGVQRLEVALSEEALDLTEVVVRAEAEDPAYAIIRKAMAKRKYYRDQVEAYSADVYVKGNIKFLDAPQKIMGIEVGDLGGSLDSNRQGIVYLSESTSKLYFREPNLYREEMISTKVSGNDNGFGFNRASEMDFNLYESYANFGREIVSPIAGNAFGYYEYRLAGTLPDAGGRLINKIELIPKRPEDPVYSGYLYIVEDLWNIQQAELMLSQGAMKIPGLDSLRIKQVHVPVAEPDVWRIFSQHLDFKVKFMAFELVGQFTAVFTGYDLQPEFEKGFFGPEIFRVEEGANELPMVYWDSIRPVPLTVEERVDYIRKDSIQEVRESKTYLDSIDARNNRFKPTNLLLGYSYNKSYEKWGLEFKSPLNNIQFNTVQGWHFDLAASFTKDYGKYETRQLQVNAALQYGFSDKRIRYSGGIYYQFDQIHRTRLRLEGGVEAAQYNPNEPISPLVNTMYSLIGRQNFMKLYERSFGKVSFERELVNGIRLYTDVEYARRSPLVNNSNYSFKDQDSKPYGSNNPQDPSNYDPAFEAHRALLFSLSLRFRIGQRYVTYPQRRFLQGSKWPDLWLDYRRGLPWLGSGLGFDYLGIRISEDYWRTGAAGYLEFRLEAGTFLSTDSLYFMDFHHFDGNRTALGNPGRYLSSFLLLPYYDYSTTGPFGQLIVQHHFNSFLLDKIPGVRKLGWSIVLGAGLLYTEDRKEYTELRAGIENIGFGAFRFLRFDGIFARRSDGSWTSGIMFGIDLDFGN